MRALASGYADVAPWEAKSLGLLLAARGLCWRGGGVPASDRLWACRGGGVCDQEPGARAREARGLGRRGGGVP